MQVIHFSEVHMKKHKGKFLRRSPKQTQLNSQNVQELKDQEPNDLPSKTSFTFKESDNSFKFNFPTLTCN